MCETALELAEATKATQLIDELREKCDEERVTEFDRVHFEEHIFWLEQTIDKLRNDYVFGMSGK